MINAAVLAPIKKRPVITKKITIKESPFFKPLTAEKYTIQMAT